MYNSVQAIHRKPQKWFNICILNILFLSYLTIGLHITVADNDMFDESI